MYVLRENQNNCITFCKWFSITILHYKLNKMLEVNHMLEVKYMLTASYCSLSLQRLRILHGSPTANKIIWITMFQ